MAVPSSIICLVAITANGGLEFFRAELELIYRLCRTAYLGYVLGIAFYDGDFINWCLQISQSFGAWKIKALARAVYMTASELIH